MIFFNVTLKALNSRVQENLKNNMTMDIHRKFFIYKIIHWARIKHVYDLIFKENPIMQIWEHESQMNNIQIPTISLLWSKSMLFLACSWTL